MKYKGPIPSEFVQVGEVELKALVKTDFPNDDDDSECITKMEPYAPEGLRGWLIVVAAFCTNFVVDGISLSYSVVTEDLTKQNNGTGSNVTLHSGSITIVKYQLVGSILLGVTLLIGPLASILAEKIGFRRAAMLGSVISTTGIFSSWLFSPDEPNFWPFLFGFGVLTGIGFGILFTLSVVIVGLFFSKNRALATGVTVSGTGFGMIAMPPLIYRVLQDYGWQGAIIFQGMVCAFSITFGMVYAELPTRAVKVRKSDVKHCEVAAPIKQVVLNLLTTPSYLIVCLSGSLIMMGYFAPIGFLVDSAAKHIGKGSAVVLLSILGITNAVGRIFFGILADKIGHSLIISNVALTVGGLITILYPFSTKHHWLIVCAIVFGLYFAMFASLRSIVIMDLVGEEKFNVAFGLSLLFMGVATFFSNSFGGYLKELTENYDMSFYVAGGFLILSAVICYPVPCIIRGERKRESNMTEEKYALSQQRKSVIDIQVKM